MQMLAHGRISPYRRGMTLVAPPVAPRPVTPDTVHDVLREHVLVDGFDMVLDLHESRGSTLVDARDGTRYLDLFTFFASSALGMNHPALTEDAEFAGELLTAARNKPSNSDVYTVPMARFVETFARVLGDPRLPHLRRAPFHRPPLDRPYAKPAVQDSDIAHAEHLQHVADVRREVHP